MRNINSANDYGWEVLSDEAWDALDMWIDTVGEEAALEDISLAMGEDSLEKTLKYIIRNYDLSEYVEDYDDIWDTFEAVKELLGASELLDAVAKALGYDELSECLAYIFRQNDFREWQERKGEEIESSRTIKSSNSNKSKAKELWAEFEDIPINDNDEIEKDFLHFESGTNRFEIWKWFEDKFDVSIEDDLMYDDEIESSCKNIKSELDTIKKKIIMKACNLLDDCFPAEIVDYERYGDGKHLLTKDDGTKIYYDSYEDKIDDIIESSCKNIKSARFIIEDENGEVIASADTYEEAESVGGMKIIDTQSKGIQSSSVGDIHDKYVLGDITKKTALQKLKELVGIEKAETLLDKWQQTCVTSKRINSSVEKAVREAEEYFGTEASDRTVICQDILTNKDNEAVTDIADKNGVNVKIGKFSVTFYEKPDYEERV